MSRAQQILKLFESAKKGEEEDEDEEYEKTIESVIHMMMKKKKKNEEEEEEGKKGKDKEEAAMGAGGEYSPYRNKFGELSNKKSAVLMIDDEGEWFRMKGGKKAKKIDMSKFGRAARRAGKNKRAYDGAKLD